MMAKDREPKQRFEHEVLSVEDGDTHDIEVCLGLLGRQGFYVVGVNEKLIFLSREIDGKDEI